MAGMRRRDLVAFEAAMNDEGSSKRAIIQFVKDVNTHGGWRFVPAAERIAGFDDDGTLWSEKPFYFQLAVALDRVRALAPKNPDFLLSCVQYATAISNWRKLMFSAKRPYRFHIELTDKCNAGCPMCPRTDPLNRSKPNRTLVRNIELSLADFQAHFTDAFCERVDEVALSGNLGDPAAASDCLEICEHLIERGIAVVISTNGGLRPAAWWDRLGRAFARNGSCVQFHIDGLRDTNPLYRIHTSFDKILANASAFIEAGGTAEWHYILFRHNEHQVRDARQLAHKTGFAKFVLIDTVRFGRRPYFRYQLPDGSYRLLEPPTLTSADFDAEPVDMTATVEHARGGTRNEMRAIDCKAKGANRPFISSNGHVSPCCWTSASPEEDAVYSLAKLDRRRYCIHTRPLGEILNDEPFATLFERNWLTGNNATCRKKCGEKTRNKRFTLEVGRSDRPHRQIPATVF